MIHYCLVLNVSGFLQAWSCYRNSSMNPAQRQACKFGFLFTKGKQGSCVLTKILIFTMKKGWLKLNV